MVFLGTPIGEERPDVAKVGMAAARRDWANTFARSGIASMAPPL